MPSDPGGQLRIQLWTRAQHRPRCEIRSTRPTRVAQVFKGRDLASSATLLPRLFPVCGQAQAFAAVTALEQASAVVPEPGISARRCASVALETVREHLWRVLLDWPVWLDQPPEQSALAEVVKTTRALQSALDPHRTLFLPGASQAAPLPAVAALTHLTEQGIFGGPVSAWLAEVENAAAFAHWCTGTDTTAARLMRQLLAADAADLGASSVRPLPQLRTTQWLALFERPAITDFLARPTLDGQPHESTPLSRQLDSPLLADLLRAHGAGLLTRLAAPLLEVARLLVALDGLEETGMLVQGAPHELLPTGQGIGCVEAARGRLVHWARVEQGRVRDYWILAPTEWNVHPRGVLAESLAALPGLDVEQLRRHAECVITAIDPCVAFELLITPEPTA